MSSILLLASREMALEGRLWSENHDDAPKKKKQVKRFCIKTPRVFLSRCHPILAPRPHQYGHRPCPTCAAGCAASFQLHPPAHLPQPCMKAHRAYQSRIRGSVVVVVSMCENCKYCAIGWEALASAKSRPGQLVNDVVPRLQHVVYRRWNSKFGRELWLKSGDSASEYPLESEHPWWQSARILSRSAHCHSP